MCFFGHQHDNAAAAGVMQFTNRACRQRAVEIRQQRGVIENAFQLGTHKEATGTVIDELVVLNNVELMLIANMVDLGDQAFWHPGKWCAKLFFVHFGVAWG
jgi:uncharacterized protein HemY